MKITIVGCGTAFYNKNHNTAFLLEEDGNSSRNLRKKHKNFLKDKLWGDHFWSPSYFLATTGNVTVDILKDYVENQRKEQE